MNIKKSKNLNKFYSFKICRFIKFIARKKEFIALKLIQLFSFKIHSGF